MLKFNVVLFDGFESLDVFGPVEVFGRMPKEYQIEYYSLEGGIVTNAQNARVQTLPFSMMDQSGILFVPGGRGTRMLVQDAFFIRKLKNIAKNAEYLLSVCTGAALFAKAGMLKGKKATTNKRAFDWVSSLEPEAEWLIDRRWVNDGTLYTSAGISAGIDMALFFISNVHGREYAEDIAAQMEYEWNREGALPVKDC